MLLQRWMAVATVAAVGVLAPAAGHADMSSIRKMLEAKHFKRAGQELQTLAERGNGWAQERLGILLKKAEGITRDDEVAAGWLTRAANQNSGAAQLHLAQYYEAGGPFPRDAGEAFFWASLAEARLPDEEREAAVKLRDAMATELDPARLDELRGRLAAWRPRFEDESATARPTVAGGRGAPVKTGSGFYVDADRVVTDYHVVDDCGWLALGKDGVQATVIAGDGVEDLAILRVEKESKEVLELSTEPVAEGAAITFLGFPGKDQTSKQAKIERGKLAASRLSAEREAFSAASGTVTHGWSGGPVLDASGRVVGVIRRHPNPNELAAGPGTSTEEMSVSSTTSRVLRFAAEHDLAPPLAAAATGSRSRTPEEAAKAVVRVYCWR
jgi:hypothetical protein